MLFGAGGRAILDCDSPLLAKWLKHARVACSILGLPCDAYIDPALGVCSNSGSPWTILLASCGLALFTLAFLGVTILQLVRWFRSRKCGTMAALAGAAAQKLQKANPLLYPLVQHSWYRLQDDQIRAPSLCAECFQALQPDTDGRRVDCCEVCGVLCHESCCRKLAHDCRPVAEVGSRMMHLWKPAGCVLVEPQEDLAGDQQQHCIFCLDHCEPDIFAQEPIWSCAWCQAVTHVRCFQNYHALHQPEMNSTSSSALENSFPQTPVVGRVLNRSSSQASDVIPEGSPSGRTSLNRRSHDSVRGVENGSAHDTETPESTQQSRKDVLDSDKVSDQQVSQPNGISRAPSTPKRRRKSGNLEKTSEEIERVRSGRLKYPALKVPSFDLGDEALLSPARVRTKHEGLSPPRNSLQDGTRNGQIGSSPRQSLQGNLRKPRREEDGSQGFGSLLDLLSTALVRASGDESSSSGSSDDEDTPSRRVLSREDLDLLDTCSFGPHRSLILPPTAVTLSPPHTWSEKAKEFLSRATPKDKSQLSLAPSGSIPEGKAGTQWAATWWGEVKESHIPWASYRIDNVPSGCKPLLVFMNSKSGPQTGPILRRKLLRLLNPIQVVELPKEKPEDALHLFADVPGLQVVVMGGDGTAGWILGCLDRIQEAREGWAPPPVAVIPMGTGNDLARCLGWGGGLHAVMSKGVKSMLLDIQMNSIVSLLDRWAVSIEPLPAPPSTTAKAKTKLKLMGNFSQSGSQQAQIKPMNNYLGIGVDAKASLDFHALRESYPSWFRSRTGNKLWYTTFGARDILGHANRGLAKNIQVICDGEELLLPLDIEGLLILNINSYMGGVDLWSSGASWQSDKNTSAKQSICDGKLEVVAVYGSWHLGQLQVGLSAAVRLTQCQTVKIIAKRETPVQIDGEPWLQAPATLQVSLKMKAFMLRKTESKPLSRMAKAVADALEESTTKGIITTAQRRALTEEIASRLSLGS